MAVDQASVTMIAPELAGEDPATFTAFIAMATRRVDPAKLAPVYEDAVNLLTAHLMTMSRKRRGNSGPMTMKHAGEVSASFGTFLRQSALMQTAYGVEYWELIRSFICNPMTV